MGHGVRKVDKERLVPVGLDKPYCFLGVSSGQRCLVDRPLNFLIISVEGQVCLIIAVGQAIEKIKTLITDGKTLHDAFSEQNLFPNIMIQLIKIGEETGQLDIMLEKISRIYNEKLNNITNNLNILLEPIIILILGTIVGGLIIGMYLPIFRLGAVV